MINTKKIKNSGLLLSLVLTAQLSFAQRGEIESQTYEIIKEKSIEFSPANKLFDKVQPVKGNEATTKVNYQLIDPQINIASPKLTPSVTLSSDANDRASQPAALNNYIKLGAGNYSRFLGEVFVSTQSAQDLVITGQLKQLSTGTGPVGGKLSANGKTEAKVGAKYIMARSKVEVGVNYNRRNHYFYGFKQQPENYVINRDSLRQTINQFGIDLGFENTDASVAVDYSVKTSLSSTKDRYNASELDWGTKLSASIPISESIHALLDADVFVSQRVDALTYNRNLFRIKPTFKYVSSQFSVSLGLNAVSETDSELDINKTKAYPVLNVDVNPFPGLHIYAGYNGDIVRNTLKSMLAENQWLGPNVLIVNTEKTSDISAGVKGETGDGFNYEGKVSYAQYRNFFNINNSLADTSKFSIIYDPAKTKVFSISGLAGYNFNDVFRSSVKAEFFDYAMGSTEEAWHRPDLTFNWFNALTISKKLFITADFYMLKGMKAKNFQTGITQKLPVIADLNLKIDYLLTTNFSAFVGINNIFGKQYERYQYYPQQGMNFIGGLSFSF